MKNWIMFGALGLIWGSSFLLIKIGVQELNPFELVSGRLGFCAIAFAIALLAMRLPIPRDAKTLALIAIVGITNTAIPFLFITSSETTIDSGLASVLNATVPLFSIVIAHLAIHDDKITMGKLLGLITGFVGVIVLATRSVDPLHPNPIQGQIGMLVATFFYAVSAVIIRRNLRHVDPMTTAGLSMFVGAGTVIVITLLIDHPLPDIAAISTPTKLAVVTLGILNTFVANSMYFILIKNWSASRATMVTYLVPIIGLLLGVLINHERFDVTIVIGTALIVGGVMLANLLRPKPVAPVEIATAGEAVGGR